MLEEILQLDSSIRYSAIRANGQLTMKSKEGLANESEAESDKYEELLVNPTLLTLAEERGNIDCGGLDYILVKYRNFFQFVQNHKDGHVSICIDETEKLIAVVEKIRGYLANGVRPS